MKYLICILIIFPVYTEAQYLKAYSSPSYSNLFYGRQHWVKGTNLTDTLNDPDLLDANDVFRSVGNGGNITYNRWVFSSTGVANRVVDYVGRGYGTNTSPSVIQNGAIVYSLLGRGYLSNGTAPVASSYNLLVDAVPTTVMAPMAHWWGTANDALNAVVERMRLTSGGRLGLGITPLATTLAHFHKSQNSPTILYLSNDNAGTGARLGIRLGTDATSIANKHATIEFWGDNAATSGILKANTFLVEGRGTNTVIGNNSATEPLQFAVNTTRTEAARFSPGGSFLINSTGGANIDPRRLYINGSIGANKDSIPVVESITNEKVLLQDTITGQFKRAAASVFNVTTLYTGSGSLSGNTTVTQASNSLTLSANTGGLFNILTSDATTNTIIESLKISHATSGTNANGSGVAIGIYNQNGSGAQVRTASVQSIMSNVTAGVESASFVLNTVAGGVLTERLRLTSNGFVGISKNNPAVTLDMDATDAIKLTYGTTAQRPSGVAGYFRGNSDSLSTEYYDGTAWRAMATREWVRENIAGGSNTIYTGDGTATNRTVTVSGYLNLIGGEVKIGSSTDRGLYPFQNTGSIYQAGLIVQAESGATYPYMSAIDGTSKKWFIGTFKDGVVTQGLTVDTFNNVNTGSLSTALYPNYSTGGNLFIGGAALQAGEYYGSWTTITSDATLSVGYGFTTILIDATAGNVTITLPVSSTVSNGSGGSLSTGILYKFKRIDNSGNTVMIQTQGSDLIDGNSSLTMPTQWLIQHLQAAGTDRWIVI